MANEVLTQGHQGGSHVDRFMGQVLRPIDKSDIARSLPSHVSFARFERNLYNCVMQNPRLMECNPREVFREVSKVAALGLYCDPHLGEAYIIKGSKGPQARIGYRGLIKLARQSGDIGQIYAHEVRENDQIDCVLGLEKALVHKPQLFGHRGKVVGFYAVVVFKDGLTDFEVMTIDQIDEIRDRSDGWRAFKRGQIPATPWSTDYDEMAKKTVMRRLCKRVPQSPDVSDAIEIEDSADAPLAQIEHGAPLADRLAAIPTKQHSIAESVDAQIAGADDDGVIEDVDTVEEGGNAQSALEAAIEAVQKLGIRADITAYVNSVADSGMLDEQQFQEFRMVARARVKELPSDSAVTSQDQEVAS
jgi:recombination protein RecT